MAEMSMNKAIHAAVRRDLGRFLDALERFPAGDRTRAAQLGTAWQNFDNQLSRHHEGEHEIAWPALQKLGVSRELLTQLDAEHDTMADTLASARTAMGTLRGTASAEDAAAARAAMQELQRVTVQHLEHEEAEIEPVYQANIGSPELKQMGREFAKVGPVEGGTFFAWALDGASPEESAAVTSTVPKPVITVVLGLFGRPYRKSVAPVWRT
ncbi:hemerythrin domain-containing protein [Kribbella shirazensis]|uniref:Hemerythrin-like domain-containing protein n=1 Tax=Kribbella shirazensis TaxID=1105143 RepID=A0A7X6A0D0_9ACTN|nr:hemerythrin domain-containing protein [Kribbella shirazensis]NIK56808.1 hemerythrin-like domain-containing protein [Kribbella shirazensis]